MKEEGKFTFPLEESDEDLEIEETESSENSKNANESDHGDQSFVMEPEEKEPIRSQAIAELKRKIKENDEKYEKLEPETNQNNSRLGYGTLPIVEEATPKESEEKNPIQKRSLWNLFKKESEEDDDDDEYDDEEYDDEYADEEDRRKSNIWKVATIVVGLAVGTLAGALFGTLVFSSLAQIGVILGAVAGFAITALLEIAGKVCKSFFKDSNCKLKKEQVETKEEKKEKSKQKGLFSRLKNVFSKKKTSDANPYLTIQNQSDVEVPNKSNIVKFPTEEKNQFHFDPIEPDQPTLIESEEKEHITAESADKNDISQNMDEKIENKETELKTKANSNMDEHGCYRLMPRDLVQPKYYVFDIYSDHKKTSSEQTTKKTGLNLRVNVDQFVKDTKSQLTRLNEQIMKTQQQILELEQVLGTIEQPVEEKEQVLVKRAA